MRKTALILTAALVTGCAPHHYTNWKPHTQSNADGTMQTKGKGTTKDISHQIAHDNATAACSSRDKSPTITKTEHHYTGTLSEREKILIQAAYDHQLKTYEKELSDYNRGIETRKRLFADLPENQRYPLVHTEAKPTRPQQPNYLNGRDHLTTITFNCT